METESESGPLAIDTTRFSPLHRIARYQSGNSFLLLRAYGIAAAILYVPLAIAALTGSDPASVTLPFFHDWNIAWTLLVSFPCLVAFTITDQAALNTSLQRIQLDGILMIPPDVARELKRVWEHRFGVVNRFALVLGAVGGAAIAAFNYAAYSPPSIGFWLTSGSDVRSTALRYAFLYAMVVLYAFIAIYVCRNLAMTAFLRAVVGAGSQLRMLPFHPDKCGGLRPVGRLGLRNQYLLTVFGINLLLLATISFLFLHVTPPLYRLIWAAAVAYIVLGPVVFIGPLLSFRAGMLRTKADLMSEVAQRLRVELSRMRKELAAGELSKEDEELIDRLRKFGAVVDELPVWPFDAGTLRKFVTAYAGPLIGATTVGLIRYFLEHR